MVVNLQKEVLGMNQWLRRKTERICATVDVWTLEQRNGSVYSVFISGCHLDHDENEKQSIFKIYKKQF
jgi:hypothetical protein